MVDTHDEQDTSQIERDIVADDDSDAPVELDGTPHGGNGVSALTDVRAEHVTLSQGGVNSIEADTVSISQGGAGKVNADQLSVVQGGVGLARTGTLTVSEGGSAFVVMADHAQIEEGGTAVLVIARTMSGDGVTALDWRATLAFGAGLGFVLFLLRRLRS